MPEYEDRLRQIPFPGIKNPDGTVSTHSMAAEVDENGDWYVFPTVQPGEDGKLKRMELREAQAKAMIDKNYKAFGKDKKSALAYAADGYKVGTNIDSDLEKQRRLIKALRGE